MKDSVNILFVCGYGVGSSVMLQTVVKKALAKYDFSFDMEHTAAGEVGGFTDWADIYAISKKLLDVVASILNTDNISFPLKISWMANQ
ncbi:Putative phosphotransferase enzyme II, B component [Salmonella enterica subsp. enterica serovar Stanley]|nr:Putative phosphotransferase enzyme II, B component [Salmonella enterica subsp. enterica serovar Stanley]